MSTASVAAVDAAASGALAPGGGPSPRAPLRRTTTAWAASVGYVLVVAGTFVWGHVVANDHELRLGAVPISGRFVGSFGGFANRWNGWAWLALVGGVCCARCLPVLATRLRWIGVLVAGFIASVAWTVVVNANDGVDGLTRGVAAPNSYFAVVASITSPRVFLRTFVAQVTRARYGIHVQGHPPGMVLVFWALDRIGLGGIGPATALVIGASALAGVAVLVVVRDVAGEERARRVMPFVVLVPAAIWLGSAPDGFFAGVSAWAIACVVLATSRFGRRSMVWAVTGAVLAAATLLLSYGLVLVFVPMAFVCWVRRRPAPLFIVAGGCAVGLALAHGLGFSWFAGLEATRYRYWHGVADQRPGGYFTVANVATLLLLVGPATPVALAWLRDSRTWLIVSGALVMAGLADASQMSRGETERIWLPFAVWLLASTSALWVGRRAARTATYFLVAQVALTMVVQTTIHTNW